MKKTLSLLFATLIISCQLSSECTEPSSDLENQEYSFALPSIVNFLFSTKQIQKVNNPSQKPLKNEEANRANRRWEKYNSDQSAIRFDRANLEHNLMLRRSSRPIEKVPRSYWYGSEK